MRRRKGTGRVKTKKVLGVIAGCGWDPRQASERRVRGAEQRAWLKLCHKKRQPSILLADLVTFPRRCSHERALDMVFGPATMVVQSPVGAREGLGWRSSGGGKQAGRPERLESRQAMRRVMGYERPLRRQSQASARREMDGNQVEREEKKSKATCC